MKKTYKDTYFLNPQVALETAKKQNQHHLHHAFIQVCYYDGEVIESDLPNLVHAPLDNLADSLVFNGQRLPEELSFEGLELSADIAQQIIASFEANMVKINELRTTLNHKAIDTAMKSKPDFNEPLRFWIMASQRTNVLRHVLKSIADTLIDMGHDVNFRLLYGTEDLSYLYEYAQYNPHVNIAINHLNNGYTNDTMFNFIWIQDYTAILNFKNRRIKDNDYFFSIHKEYKTLLESKGIDSLQQSFCVNTKDYYIKDNIERKKKIVFVGSSYGGHLDPTRYSEDMIPYLAELFHQGVTFSNEKVREIADEKNADFDYLVNHLVPFVVRDLSVILLCQVESNYEVEVYGKGWEDYTDVGPHFKGFAPYGEELANIYNSATYCFSPSSELILMQRVFEASACGAIPILYDCKTINDDDPYEEAFIYYKTGADLQAILTNDEVPQKDFTRLLSENSYENFANKVLSIIERNTKDGEAIHPHRTNVNV